MGLWSISAGQMVAAVSILALGAVNYVGVKSGNRLQATLTVVKIVALAALPIVALTLHPVTPSFTPVVPPIANPAAAFGVVMIAVMWAYEGWYYLPFCAGEIKDPRRTVPIALVVGIVALVLIYLSVNLSYMLALPLGEIQGVERIAEKAVTALVGAGGARIVAATVVVSTLGCNAAAVIAMSRACYAMASDGMFFKAAAAVHPRYRTPHVAIAMTCAWSALLTLTGTYEQLFTWVTFASVTFGVLGGCRDLPAAAIEAGCAAAVPHVGLSAGACAVCRRARRARRQYRRREAGRVSHRRRSRRARPSRVRVLARGT